MSRSLFNRAAIAAVAVATAATLFSTTAEARYYRGYGYHHGYYRGGAVAAGIIGAAAGLAIAGAASRSYYYGGPYYDPYDAGPYYRPYRVYYQPRVYYEEEPVVIVRRPRVRVYEAPPVYYYQRDHYFRTWYENR